MTPQQLAACGTEHGEQCAVFLWSAQHLNLYPELRWMYAIANGGDRTISQGARLKAEGVKSGVSDICLPVARHGYHGFYIEMKKSGGTESDKQKEFGEFLTTQGYLYSCCVGWLEAVERIIWYMD